jgi:origin recognition complex subunit 4
LAIENLKATNNNQFYTIWLNGFVHIDDKSALQSIIRQIGIEQGEEVVSMSFAERLRFLLQALQKGGSNATPVVFVVDEMDLFADHTNQILLYNLFDIAQSDQTPICVVGVSSRLVAKNLCLGYDNAIGKESEI